MESARKYRHHAGFSLVEVMIAASLSLVVFAMAFTALIRFSKVHLSLATQADLDREFRYAVSWLADDFRGLQSIELVEPEEEEDSLEVIISLPNLRNDSGETPQRTEVIYRLNEDSDLQRLYTEYGAGNSILNERKDRLLSGVTKFEVIDVDEYPSYDITIACARNIGGREYDKSLETRITTRN
ncbi:MAG: PulJ/GspJ family protein [Puniceicoccales bacterium]